MGAHEPESPIEHEGETVTDAGYVTTNKMTNCCPKELVSAPYIAEWRSVLISLCHMWPVSYEIPMPSVERLKLFPVFPRFRKRALSLSAG